VFLRFTGDGMTQPGKMGHKLIAPLSIHSGNEPSVIKVGHLHFKGEKG